MYYPPVSVELYTTHPMVVNGTIQDTHANLGIFKTSLSMPFLALSCIAVLFSTTTAGLVQRGLLSQDNHYTYELLCDTGLWDLIFWMFCGGAHTIVIIVIMSPADSYAASISILLVVYFLGRICAPRGCQISMTQENINLLGFCAGLFIAAYNVPDTHSGRGAALMLTVLLDYMLGVGHTWDLPPAMDTVTNCRLFWVCCSSLCLAALYGAWHDHLLVERVA